jgi:hypothetical protein
MASTLPTLPASALTFDDEFNTFVSSPDGSQKVVTQQHVPEHCGQAFLRWPAPLHVCTSPSRSL